MIITIMIRPLRDDMQVLSFCDVLEDVVDSKTSKKFVQNLRSGMLFQCLCNLTILSVSKKCQVCILQMVRNKLPKSRFREGCLRCETPLNFF